MLNPSWLRTNVRSLRDPSFLVLSFRFHRHVCQPSFGTSTAAHFPARGVVRRWHLHRERAWSTTNAASAEASQSTLEAASARLASRPMGSMSANQESAK